MEGSRRSNLAQKNILTLATARLKNLFCTILPLLVSLSYIGVMQEVYLQPKRGKETCVILTNRVKIQRH